MSIPGAVIPLPDWTTTYRPAPAPGESYQDYLHRAIDDLDAGMGGQLLQGATLERYFGHGELVVPGYRRKMDPPRELFSGLVLPFALAILLRHTQVIQGQGPLLVVATYRPLGGATKSKHKVNAAIDVRPPKLTRAACRALMVGAGWVYRQHPHLCVGVGTYGPHMDRTTLVHIDAGARKRRTSWRQIKGVSTTSAITALPPTGWEG